MRENDTRCLVKMSVFLSLEQHTGCLRTIVPASLSTSSSSVVGIKRLEMQYGMIPRSIRKLDITYQLSLDTYSQELLTSSLIKHSPALYLMSRLRLLIRLSIYLMSVKKTEHCRRQTLRLTYIIRSLGRLRKNLLIFARVPKCFLLHWNVRARCHSDDNPKQFLASNFYVLVFPKNFSFMAGCPTTNITYAVLYRSAQKGDLSLACWS